MPYRPCPNCRATAPRLLEATSAAAYVWYVRCATCGHVWTISKDGKETTQDVTVRTNRDQPRL